MLMNLAKNASMWKIALLPICRMAVSDIWSEMASSHLQPMFVERSLLDHLHLQLAVQIPHKLNGNVLCSGIQS